MSRCSFRFYLSIVLKIFFHLERTAFEDEIITEPLRDIEFPLRSASELEVVINIGKMRAQRSGLTP